LQDDVLRAESDASGSVAQLLVYLLHRVPVKVEEAASEQPPDLTFPQAQVWNARNQLNELQETMKLKKRKGWVDPQ